MATLSSLVVMVACYATVVMAAPQLFPFSSLSQYFDHKTRNGPGAIKLEISPSVDTPAIAKKSLEPKDKVQEKTVSKEGDIPPNHKREVTDILKLSKQSVAEASPVLAYHQLLPTKVLIPQVTIQPVNYANIVSTNNNSSLSIPQASAIYTPIYKAEPQNQNSFLGGKYPPVPSQILQAPPVTTKFSPVQFIKPSTIDTGIYDILKVKPVSESIKPKKESKVSSPLYPKKYKPELDQNKITLLGVVEASSSKKNHFPKKEDYPLVKQQKQNAENVAATIEAASFQKKALPIKTSLPSLPKVATTGEQATAESGFSGISHGAGGGLGFGGGHGHDHHHAAGGHDRVDFQMHGHHGPHSYKFGFDTGKGHNRQFRYEERDSHGNVKGHYGFYNKHGKLQIVNYSAHPEHGFHADGNFGKHGI